jgi:hypothetical protein
VGRFKVGADLAAQVCALPALAAATRRMPMPCGAGALEALGNGSRPATTTNQALALAHTAADTRCEAAVLVRVGGLHARAGPGRCGARAHAQALTLARAWATQRWNARRSTAWASWTSNRGEVDLGTHSTTSRPWRWRGARPTALARHLLGNLGNLQATPGPTWTSAPALCEDALQVLRALGDRQREGNTLCNLGMLRTLQGDLDERRRAGARPGGRPRTGPPRLECTAQNNLGLVCMGQRRLRPTLCTHHEAALRVARGHWRPAHPGAVPGHLGLAQARCGAFDAARQSLGNMGWSCCAWRLPTR